MGANCVRISFSVEEVLDNPRVHRENIIAVSPSECPGLDVITAMELFDCVVHRLTADDLMRLHGWLGRSNTRNKQGLWNSPGYPTSDCIASLRNVLAHYSSNPLVVSMDIRNEIHDRALLRTHRSTATPAAAAARNPPSPRPPTHPLPPCA
jgi:hypothetical protein